MGLNKFVSLFADAVLRPDCNLHQHRHKVRPPPDGRNGTAGIATSATYSSELDIYGTTARFKKSMLWSSLRKPRKSKGRECVSVGVYLSAGNCQVHESERVRSSAL